jgi:hypothetical protein
LSPQLVELAPSGIGLNLPNRVGLWKGEGSLFIKREVLTKEVDLMRSSALEIRG